jgi:hypothetical protein
MSRSRVTLLHAEERWSGKKGNKGTGGCQMQSMSSSLTDRMIRAARLETSVYEEVEADPAATQQALWVVIIAAAAEGIGIAIRAAMQGRAGGVIIVGLILGIISALIGWIVWSYVTYFIGTRLFRGTATPGEMLRTIGFAQSPRVLDILSRASALSSSSLSRSGCWLPALSPSVRRLTSAPARRLSPP